jgi:hypothetical protein
MLFELIPRVPAAFVVLFSTNPFAPAAYAAEGVPDRLRSIQFEYRTDIPVTDSQAHKLEVWIPLSREDGWQRVEALSIDTPDRRSRRQPPEEGRLALPAGTCDLRIRNIGHEVRQNGQGMGSWRRGLRM